MDAVNGPPALGSIQFLTGSLAGSTYPINKPSTSIGRDPSNDIVISDPSVSRQHAQITLEKGVWSITKLAQQNTMTVNQKEVPQSPLTDRDTIGLGTGTTFRFQVNAATPNQSQPKPHKPRHLASENP